MSALGQKREPRDQSDDFIGMMSMSVRAIDRTGLTPGALKSELQSRNLKKL